MKIKSIRLRNFQSHKDSILELSTGVNAVVGLSRAGKSAILRGLHWVFENTPSGDVFLSHWGGDASVSVEFENGLVVIREKGKAVNQYRVKNPGTKEQVFEGFGQGVPDVIRGLLNINDFNMRFQHQGAFLLSDTAGKISQYLNKVARLDDIDKAITNIESVLKKEKRQVEAEGSIIAQLTTELMVFEYLAEAENQLLAVEQLHNDLARKTVKYNSLLDTVEEIEKATERIKVIQKITVYSKRSQQLVERAKKLKEGIIRAEALQRLCDGVANCDEQIKVLLEVVGFKGSVLRLIDTKSEINLLLYKREFLNDLVSSVKSLSLKRKEKELEMIESQQNFSHYMPVVCPLCGK